MVPSLLYIYSTMSSSLKYHGVVVLCVFQPKTALLFNFSHPVPPYFPVLLVLQAFPGPLVILYPCTSRLFCTLSLPLHLHFVLFLSPRTSRLSCTLCVPLHFCFVVSLSLRTSKSFQYSLYSKSFLGPWSSRPPVLHVFPVL